MIEPYHRTGQAGRLLGISAYYVRRLAAAGLIKSVLTASGQRQIPTSEIRRLQERGIPRLRVPLGGARSRRRRPRMDEMDNQAPAERPPGCFHRGSESANQVKIAKNSLEQREVELDIEEVEDEFRLAGKEKARARGGT